VCVGLLQEDKVKHFFLFFSSLSLSLSLPLKSATILRFSADMHTQKLPQACESQYVIQFFSQSAIITIQPPGQSWHDAKIPHWPENESERNKYYSRMCVCVCCVCLCVGGETEAMNTTLRDSSHCYYQQVLSHLFNVQMNMQILRRKGQINKTA